MTDSCESVKPARSTPSPPGLNGGQLPVYSEYALESVDNLELLALVERYQQEYLFVKLDNTLIELFLKKNKPSALNGINQMLHIQKTQRRIQFAVDESRDISKRAAAKSHHSLAGRGDGPEDTTSVYTFTSRIGSLSVRTMDSMARADHRLSVSMKIELCEKQCKELKIKLNRSVNETKIRLRKIYSKNENFKLTNLETQDTIDVFNDYVMTKGYDEITNKIPLERFVKFIQNYVKNANGLIEKIHLKTVTLNAACKQLLMTLGNKVELNDRLRPVDYDKLLIDRIEMTREMDEKTEQIIELKRITGHLSLMVTNGKKSLNKIEKELNRLSNQKMDDERQMDKLREEQQKISKVIEMWQQKMDKLQTQMDTYLAPSAHDYSTLIHQMQLLDKEEKHEQRRNYIQNIQLRNTKKKLAVKKLEEKLQRERMELINKQFKEMFR